jgi:hypothetical protein
MDVTIIKFLQVMKCIEGYKIIVLKLFLFGFKYVQ